MKLFISADIEGTCGIADWQETNTDNQYSMYFQTQMTNEVSAACEGATKAGFDDIVIKDAHDSARNLLPNLLPKNVRILRGWPRDPLCMMSGLDNSFDAAVFTGYHSAAGTAGNPLSHTMQTQIYSVFINGICASEFFINALTASYYGVPCALLTGDKALCESARELIPTLGTVAVSEGIGNGSLSLQPSLAVEKIREQAFAALSGDYKASTMALPPVFSLDVAFKRHFDAYSASFYPGCRRISGTAVRFECRDWFDALRFIHFTM